MQAMKIGLTVIGVLGIVSIIFLVYSGMFTEIIVGEKEMGPYVIVYDEHKGEYKGTKEVQDEIYDSLLNNEGIETFKGFGIYYDDPKKVAKEELRSIAGCILEKDDYDKINKLKDKGYKIRELDRSDSVTVEFPYKSPISVLIGIMKVYPAIDEYTEKNGITKNEMMEVYDIPNKKIIYVMDCGNYNGFME